MAMIQKTNIDTLHKEGKSQRAIAERGGCYRVLYQSILNAKLTGRKNLGRKRCTSNRDDRKLENTVKQSWFKHLWELHKEWTEAGVSASRVTTLRRLQEKGYQATSEPETTSEASYLGCGEKERDCCSVVQSPQNPCCLKSSVKFPQSVMIWAAMSSAGVCPLFSEVHSQRSHLPGNFRALHASFCWQALWRCRFHFPAGLGTCPHCQRYQKLVQWPWCYCAWLASKLAWPEPHRESMGYCQEEDERHQTQQCRWAEGHCQRNLGFHTTSAVPQTDHLHATPNWGSN